MRVVTVAERRARLARRHLLARPGHTVDEVADAVVVLHATDPATVYLSVLVRMAQPSIDEVALALYDDRSIVRVLAMRRTLFVASRTMLPIIEAAASVDIADNERRRLERFLAESGIDDPPAWLRAAHEEIDEAMPANGASARQLTRLVPRLATKIVMGEGTKHAVMAGATSRVLGVLAAEGHLLRGRPAGSWTGRQYRWYRRQEWLGDETDPMNPPDAATELVRCWLERFGPGTFEDLKWWTGWTVRKLRSAMEQIDVTEVDLGGRVGLVVVGDELDELDESDARSPDEPWVALLPSLDPTPMGWKEREWYLGDHAGPLLDRFGNIGPTVWCDGRIVGGWSQKAGGEIVTRCLEDVGSVAEAQIVAKAERLGRTLADTVVKPSFPTPLQRELAGLS